MIKAEIVADSVNEAGRRITTFMLTYPRFIHSELMTHRQFSRNAASSRAIPVEKMIWAIRETPAMPVEWGTMQKGMQAGPPLEGEDAEAVLKVWIYGLDHAVATASELMGRGVHKQIANRVLEPWMHMTTLVTSTEFGNFYRLRAHPEAQPEFQELAYCMLEAHLKSQPENRVYGSWHLPFVSDEERYDIGIVDALKASTARCARTSYSLMGKMPTTKDEQHLHDRLLTAGHMSPFEHPACSDFDNRSNNFVGWKQYRQDVETRSHENLTREEMRALLDSRPKRVLTSGTPGVTL
jgi:thymidylate synthase ThyX